MLYDFTELRNLIEARLGISTERVNSGFIAIRESFTHEELDKNIKFDPDGIFLEKGGKRYRGFLYIGKGHDRQIALKNNWGTIVPKFHICNCSVIEKQKYRKRFDGHYVFSNQPVLLEELDGTMQDPRLCKVCIKTQPEINSVITTEEFCELIRKRSVSVGEFGEKDIPVAIPVDQFGYTPGWAEQSKQYRLRMDYACESCGIRLNDSYAEGYYLETHHINGVKTDNRDSNLMCLCTLCHSEMNEFHQENYSRGANLRKLKDFVEQYSDRLESVGNPYINARKIRLRRASADD